MTVALEKESVTVNIKSKATAACWQIAFFGVVRLKCILLENES